jgi:hypothetical protein
MEDYIFFPIFFMNNKLITAVLYFGSHICNQAARIRVNNKSYPAQESVSVQSDPDSIVMHSSLFIYRFCQSCEMMMTASLVNGI